MLEIREKILELIKTKQRLTLSANKALFYEIIDFKDGQFIYFGGNSLSNVEEYRYSLSPKQALQKICSFYREKANITATPGYNEVYKFMIENSHLG
jgi:hypothetical protein